MARRRVLIVCPSFPPKSTADLHRVRMSLPYYRAFGWEPTILCVTPETCEGIDDPLLAETLPKDIEIVRVPAWDQALCRRLGFNLLDYRALVPLYRAGNRLLAEKNYDLVFFSTTAFLTWVLGPLWRKRFGAGIVYDIQDPWYHGEDRPYRRDNAPGGWRRYRLSQWIAKQAEPFALRAADRIISVSPGYAEQLCRRYDFLNAAMFEVIPFGVAPCDYQIVRHLKGREAEPSGVRRWVSVGRAGGADMDPILEVFFAQLAALREESPGIASSLRIDFIGTNYAPKGRSKKLVLPLASAHGVEDMVSETSERVPYFEALAAYAESDAILLFGSESADYVASRLFNAVGAAKPVLAMFRAQSLVAKIAGAFPNVRLATFDDGPRDAGFAAAVSAGLDWLGSAQFSESEVAQALLPWSAEALTKRQCQVFDSASAAKAARAA